MLQIDNKIKNKIKEYQTYKEIHIGTKIKIFHLNNIIELIINKKITM